MLYIVGCLRCHVKHPLHGRPWRKLDYNAGPSIRAHRFAMTQPTQTPKRVAVIGGGPAGLMAAEVLAAGGVQVDV
ncbi:FAD-dependent monooxygenase, partial [Acinetobacter baumannii]|uniref:FAD-dependent monooxygenase n=1 Tax=Acinetobacter baumannii TaxID=470 RepID=UPI00286ED8B2